MILASFSSNVTPKLGGAGLLGCGRAAKPEPVGAMRMFVMRYLGSRRC